MGLLRNARQFILRFDLFSTDACLRYKGEPCYESLQCGTFSLILIALFLSLFAMDVYKVLAKQEITSTTTITDSPQSSKEISDFRLALQMKSVTTAEFLQHFDLDLTITGNSNGSPNTEIDLPLEQCSLQENEWKSMGERVQKYYNQLDIGSMHCIPVDSRIKMFGYQGSSSNTQVVLKISRCDGAGCSDDATFNTFVNNHLDNNDFFNIRLLLVDKVFSPDELVPYTNTVERQMFISFSDTLGTRGIITLASYQIKTDESIWPYEDIVKEEGNYIEKYDFSTTSIRSNNFVRINIRKSTLEMEFSRNYGKIDDLLSYIGGLFSLIFFVLYFLFGSFNQYRYELMVAENSFEYDGKSQNVRQQDMGVLGYIKYQIYDWVKTFGCKISWNQMQRIHNMRTQATEQLDIRHIMNKLRYLEQVLSVTHDESLLVCAKIAKPQTLNQVRINRKMIQYYHKIEQSNPHIRQVTLKQQFKETNSLDEMADIRPQKHRYGDDDTNRGQQLIFRSLSQIRNQSYSQTTIHPSENVISKSNRNKEEVKKVGRCQKCYNCFKQFFEDGIDSDDEEAELKIYEMYQKMEENNSQHSSKLKESIPPLFKNVLNKSLHHSKHDNKDNNQWSIDDLK